MNHIYKVIWNTITQTWVAVSELSRAKGKTKSSKTLSAVVLAAGALVGNAEAAVSGTEVGNGVSLGIQSSAYHNGVAVGNEANTNTGHSNIAVGYRAKAGTHNNAPEQSSIAIGYDAKANTVASVVMGAGAKIEPAGGKDGAGNFATVIGADALVTKDNGSAFGQGATATGAYATALGKSALAKEDYSIALGKEAQAKNGYSTSVGFKTEAKGLSSLALGSGMVPLNDITGDGKVNEDDVAKQRTIADGDGAFAAGASANAKGSYASALSAESTAKGDYAFAAGAESKATANNATALGKQANASGDSAVAVGAKARASNNYDAAFGSNATASGSYSSAFGNNSQATKADASAFGNEAKALTVNATSVGAHSKVDTGATYGSALGRNASVTAANGTALGSLSSVTAANGTAVGTSATVSTEGGVALGQGSASTRPALDGKNITINSQGNVVSSVAHITDKNDSPVTDVYAPVRLINDPKVLERVKNTIHGSAGAVSLGKDGETTRQLTNLAPGSADSDAVNVAQLKAVVSAFPKYSVVGENGVTVKTDPENSSDPRKWKVSIDPSYVKNLTKWQIRDTKTDGNPNTNVQNTDVTGGDVVTFQDTDTIDVERNGKILKFHTKKNIKYFSVKSSGGGNENNDGAKGNNAIAIGKDTRAGSQKTIALGNEAITDAEFSMAIGTAAHTRARSAVALGKDSRAYGENGFALGNNAISDQHSALALGPSANAMATDAIAMGKSASSAGDQSISIGVNSSVSGNKSVAIGAGATAGSQNTAVNEYISAQKDYQTKLYDYDRAFREIIAGDKETLDELRKITNGNDAINAINQIKTATSNNAKVTALIQKAQLAEASKDSRDQKITAYNTAIRNEGSTVAIGSGAVANIANGIALGSQSKTTTDKGQTGFDASQDADGARVNTYANLTNNNQNVTTSILAGLSIGDTGKTRQINHLAAGTADDDAVNVAQLKSVNLAFKGDNNTKGDVRLHDQRLSVVGATGSFITTKASDNKLEISTTQGTFSTTDGKSSAPKQGLATTTAVASAINDSGWEVQAKGKKVGLVNPSDKVNFTNADKSIEIESSAEPNGLSTIKFKAVTETIQTEEKSPITQIDVNGSTVSKTTKGKNEPTGRFVVPTGDKANKYALATAYDVADKVNQTGWNLYTNGGARSLINPGDYVNFKSGNATNAKVVTEASEGATISYDVNVDNTTIKIDPDGNKLTANTVDLTVSEGKVTTPTTDDGQKLVNATTVANAINKSYWTAKQGKHTEDNTESTNIADSQIKAGDELTFASGKNMALKKAGNKFIYATKDDVTFTDVTTTNTTTTNLTVKNGGNVDMGNNKVKNVADGNVTSDSKEAVNGSQLYAVDNKFNNTVTLGGEKNSATEAQKLNKDGGLKFNIVGAENGNITTTASGTDVKIDLTQGTKDDIKKGVDAHTTVTTKGLTFNGNTGNTGIKKLGSEVDVKGGTTNNVITTTANDKGIAINYNGTEAAKVTNLTYKANGQNPQNVSLATGLNFKDGQGTTVTVGADGEVTYNANVAGLTAGDNVKITEDGKGNFTIAATDTNTQSTVSNATGSAITVTPTNNTDGTKNYELDVNVDNATIKKENGVLKAVIPEVKTVALTNNAGKVGDVSADDANKFVTGDNLAKTINATYWKVSQGAHEESTSEETTGVASSEIKPGDELTFASGKNMALKKAGNKFIYATKDDVTFTDVTTTNTTTTNLTVKNGGNVDMGNNKVKNVADGNVTSDSKEAVNGSQLYHVMTNATAGWNLSVNNGNDKGNVKPGAQVDLNNTDGNIIISKNANNVTFNFNPNATFGVKGEQGKDGIDGSIGVNGKDGSAVAINGKDGSIGLNGKDGKNGLTIKGQDGKVGVDGKDGETRLVYVEKADPTKPGSSDKTHELATLDDGMKYGGDIGEVANVKLNKQVDIKGGVTDKTKLSDNNIGVISTPNATTGGTELTVKLAKELKGLTSAEFNDGKDKTKTEITHNGIAITPVNPENGKTSVTLTDKGLNNGGNTITNVAEGKNGTDAVNVNQLNKVEAKINEGGLTFAGNSGTPHKANLNTTVNIKGGKDNTDATQFDDGKNVMTTVNKNTVTVAIKKTPEVEGINIIDKDGKVKVKLTQTNEGLKVSDGNDKETRITNVAEGKNGTDAVNVKQLNAAKTEVTAGDNIDVVSRTGANGQTIYKVSTKGINDTSAAVKAGSNHVEVTKAANTHKDGSTTVTDYTVDLSKETKEDIKKGVDAHTEVTTKGLTFNADHGTTGVKKLGSKVAVNGDGKNITTTADENGVKVSMKDDIKVNSVTAKEVKVGDVNINENGINAGGKRITNVAPGKDGTDAVNVNQLKYVAGNISNQINNVDKGLRAGIAGALASGGLYHVTTAGKSMVSVGAGTYRGQNALAVGYSRLSDNGKVGVKFTVNSNSQGHSGASASVGYQW